MLEVIICSCNKNLGCIIDLYDYCFEIIKKDFKQKKVNQVAIDRVMWDPKWTVEVGSLMDLLHIERECCRVNVLSKIKVSQLH
jgi:hypothetical protein